MMEMKQQKSATIFIMLLTLLFNEKYFQVVKVL